MQCLVTELIKAKASLPDDRQVSITGGWIVPETGVLRYISVDLGGWLGSDEVLVAPDRLTWAGADAPAALDLTQRAIERAPRWPDTDGPTLADWPAILIGPLGNTVSVPLVEAQARDTARPARPADPDASAPHKVGPLTALTDLLGQPVFDHTGELGALTDMRLSTSGRWSILDLIVGDAGAAVPFANLRHVGRKAGHLVVARAQPEHADV